MGGGAKGLGANLGNIKDKTRLISIFLYIVNSLSSAGALPHLVYPHILGSFKMSSDGEVYIKARIYVCLYM